jgi:hypothetical protein
MFNGLSGGQPGLPSPTWGLLRTFFAIPGIEHIPFVLDSLAGGRVPTDDVEAIISRAIAPMQQSFHGSLSQVFTNNFILLCSCFNRNHFACNATARRVAERLIL